MKALGFAFAVLAGCAASGPPAGSGPTNAIRISYFRFDAPVMMDRRLHRQTLGVEPLLYILCSYAYFMRQGDYGGGDAALQAFRIRRRISGAPGALWVHRGKLRDREMREQLQRIEALGFFGLPSEQVDPGFLAGVYEQRKLVPRIGCERCAKGTKMPKPEGKPAENQRNPLEAQAEDDRTCIPNVRIIRVETDRASHTVNFHNLTPAQRETFLRVEQVVLPLVTGNCPAVLREVEPQKEGWSGETRPGR